MTDQIVMTRRDGGRCYGWTLAQYWALHDAVLAGEGYRDFARDLTAGEAAAELARLEARGPWAGRPE